MFFVSMVKLGFKNIVIIYLKNIGDKYVLCIIFIGFIFLIMV